MKILAHLEGVVVEADADGVLVEALDLLDRTRPEEYMGIARRSVRHSYRWKVGDVIDVLIVRQRGKVRWTMRRRVLPRFTAKELAQIQRRAGAWYAKMCAEDAARPVPPADGRADRAP